MDWLTFTATMAGHLAWPTAALVVAIVFRKQINVILARPAKRLKAGPFEAEWETAAAEAKSELESAPEAAIAARGDDRPAQLRALAADLPRGAVLEAAAELEVLLRRLLQENGADDHILRTSIRQMAREARRRGLISEDLEGALGYLSVLRNLAAHGSEPLTSEQATEFIMLSTPVRLFLDSAGSASSAEQERLPLG